MSNAPLLQDESISNQTLPESPELLRANSKNVLRKVQNPFEIDNPWTPYEYFKAVVVGCTLFPIRLVVLIFAFLLQAFFARLVYIGVPLDNDRGCLYHKEQFSRTRELIRKPMYFTNRLILWALGFWWIKVDDRRKGKTARANIIVAAPHLSVLDPFIMAAVLHPFPSGVGKADVLDIPLLSYTGPAAQGIFVDRRNPESRHACKEAIKRRADPSWTGSPLLIFPEGTTTNGKMLIQFKLGAFCPGQPVQPALMCHKGKHFKPANVGHSNTPGVIFLRSMLQFANFCTVVLTDPYVPSEEETAHPLLFANNCRDMMARTIGVGTTEHTYDDVWFYDQAAEKAGVSCDFELQQIKALFDVDIEGLKILLKRFKEFDLDDSGLLSRDEFEKALGLGRGSGVFSNRSSASVDNFFHFFDTDGSGFISYREFVQGLALLSGKCSPQSQAKLAFLIFDVEGSRRVRTEHLKAALSNVVPDHASPALFRSLEGVESLSFKDFCALLDKHPAILQEMLDMARKRVGLTFESAMARAAELSQVKQKAKT